MKINFSSNPDNISFKGLPRQVVDPKIIKAAVECKLGNIASSIIEGVERYAPDVIDKNGFIKNPKPFQAFFESLLYPIKAPIDYLRGKKRLSEEEKLYQRAARGIYQYAEDFARNAKPGEFTGECGDGVCRSICKATEDGFYGEFAKKLSLDTPKYGTRNERALNRLITALIPAVFLGNDFYNRAIRDGKTGEEAQKEAEKKRGQEIIAGVGEAYTQFAVLGGFPVFINNSQFAAPVINTLIGLFFHITSRLHKDIPLTFVDIPNKPAPKGNSVTIDEFLNKIKNSKAENIGIPFGNNKKEEKKHILTLKNIALACIASILGGFTIKFGLRGIKNKEIGKFLNKKVESVKNCFEKITTKEKLVDKQELELFYAALEKTNNHETYTHYERILNNEFKTNAKNGKISLGRYNDTIDVFGCHLTKKALYQVPLAPFKFIVDVLSFPYRATAKILKGLGVKEFQDKKPTPDKLNGAIEFFRDFERQRAKFKDPDGPVFLEHYKKHLERNALMALDREGNSKIDNSKIGQLTQTIGTAMSLYFATLDDYNFTARRTGNKEQAEHDARERGINKFFRIVSQIVLMDVFNGVFKIPYMQSLFASLGISGVCTVVTDIISRKLAGMPSERMETKEEIQKYKEEQRNGTFGWYFRMIDRLAQ